MKFKDLRRKIGTQEEFANLIGVSQYQVCRWENGRQLPKSKDLVKIAKVCDVSVEELLLSFQRSK